MKLTMTFTGEDGTEKTAEITLRPSDVTYPTDVFCTIFLQPAWQKLRNELTAVAATEAPAAATPA